MSPITSVIAPTGACSTALVVWLDEDDDLNLIRAAVDKAVLRARGPAPEEEEIEGWTRATLKIALARLERQNGKVQAAAISHALCNDGYITREAIRKIGKYPRDRMLRGFTRPPSRIVEAMKRSRELPEHAVDLLWASYQDGVQADGFYAPVALKPFVID